MPSQANALNISTVGIVGDTGTGFTATPLTQHRIILGGSTSSTLGQVSSVGTAGQCLLSNGAGTDPSFQDFTSPTLGYSWITTSTSSFSAAIGKSYFYIGGAGATISLPSNPPDGTILSFIMCTPSNGGSIFISCATGNTIVLGTTETTPITGNISCGETGGGCQLVYCANQSKYFSTWYVAGAWTVA